MPEMADHDHAESVITMGEMRTKSADVPNDAAPSSFGLFERPRNELFGDAVEFGFAPAPPFLFN